MKNKKRNLLIILGLLLVIIVIFLLLKFFNQQTYTITFETNGGSIVRPLEIKENGLVIKPDDPKKEGYTFDGWYLEDKPFDFQMLVKENLTLEARWVENTSEFNLNASSLTLKVGEEATLKANINEDLTWQSSNANIVSVDKDGKLKALKTGEVTITVTNKNGKTATCKIMVTEKKNDEVEVTKVEITGKKEVTVGNKIKLTVKITPNDATNKKVTWKSSNSQIATVDASGNVKGIKEGTVTIVATSSNGKSASIKITIKAKASTSTDTNSKPSSGSTSTGSTNTGNSSGSTSGGTTTPEKPKDVPVTKVTLSGATSVNVNSSIQLTVNITPSNATNKKYTCTGNNPNVATVSSSCKVTGKDDGEVTVTVTTADGKHTATHTVTVKSTYRAEFKRHFNDYDKVVGYYVSIYRNGAKWTGYASLTIDGKYKTLPDGYGIVGSDIPDEAEKKLETITINLKNGDSVSATVKYVN